MWLVTVVRVQVLYFDDCPNWEATARLAQALMPCGSEPELVRVETPADAERWQFRGSPTVLIDGSDPFFDGSTPVGLACRVYRTPAGLAGAPTTDQLAAAFAAASAAS